MRFDNTRLSTGPRIHYAESGDARGTPVVFVHGWAARIAKACRCDQELRVFGVDRQS